MPEYEVDGVRAVYDHETEDPRSGARRRPVADWGVGEELFDHMPRTRFGRTSDAQRRDPHPRERSGSARAEDFQPGDEPAAAERPAAERPAAERPAAERRRALEADRLAAAPTADLGSPAPAPAPAPAGRPADAPTEAPMATEPAEATPRLDAVDGRRTIVIGRSVEPHSVTRRPRPQRSVGDRVGHRPDRIAMWAVALGMLLILIAILTAGA
jgi:hypothetical protein